MIISTSLPLRSPDPNGGRRDEVTERAFAGKARADWRREAQ